MLLFPLMLSLSYCLWTPLAVLSSHRSPIFPFWIHLMLITCCSRILIQPMSVFLFFHSPRFFWFVLCETLLIFCCLVPSFNYHIASPLLPCSCSVFLWIQCSSLLLELFPLFCFLPSKTFCSASHCKVCLANFQPWFTLNNVFSLAKPFWWKSDDPDDFFHHGFIPSSPHPPCN